MNKLLLIIILLCPTLAMAGALDMGYKSIRTEQTETSYHLGLGYDKAGAGVDMEYNYGKLGDVVSTDNARISLGYDAQFSNKWGIWLDETIRYDNPAGIEVENLLGAGPKYIIYQTKQTKASISFGYMAHYQAMMDDTKHTTERWSWRFKFRTDMDSSYVGLVSMYQPAVGNPDDYIFDNSAWYGMVINDKVDLKLSLKDEYRSAIDTRNLSRIMAVVYKF